MIWTKVPVSANMDAHTPCMTMETTGVRNRGCTYWQALKNTPWLAMA